LGAWWTYYWAGVHFVFGAVVGSFLNVCIWRLPRGESLLEPPSHCPACNHRLHLWPDMVLLLSQAWMRGRCRYCGARFSWRYFWVEALTGGLFLACYLAFRGNPWVLYPNLVFVAALIVVFFIDLDHYVIHEWVVYLAIAAAVVEDIALILQGVRPLWQTVPGAGILLPLPLSLLGAVLGFWLLWSFATLMTAALNREAMGSGDSYLLAAMGANLIPWPRLLLAFFMAVAIGSVVGVILLVLHQRAHPEPADESAGGETEEDLEPEIPRLTADARLGRLLTLGGGWLVLAGGWVALAFWGAGRAPAALGVLLGTAAAAAMLIRVGVRRWLAGDRQWLPQMDEVFEDGDPGPRIIPFGPYLVIGTFIALFWGDQIIAWYLRVTGMAGPGSGAGGPGL